MVAQCPDCGGQVSQAARACPHCGRPTGNDPKVVLGESQDLIFYNTVRSTVHGLDHLRVRTVVSGLTFVLGLLSAAAFSWRNIPPEKIFGVWVPLSDLVALLFSLTAAILSTPFLSKMNMFNKFIWEAVKIARGIEPKVLSTADTFLTQKFQDSHPRAGQGGDFMFKIALHVMRVLAVVAVLFFVWRTYLDWGIAPS